MSRCFHFKHCVASRLLLLDQMILVDWYLKCCLIDTLYLMTCV